MKIAKDKINKLVYNIFKQNDPILAELIVNWVDVVGKDNGKNSYPEKVRKRRTYEKREEKTLYINATDSATAIRLQFSSEQICERISVYFGYKVIDKIIVMNR